MILRQVYHFNVRAVRRSVVAAAAYIAGESLYDMKYLVRRNFAWRRAEHRNEIVFSELFLPGNRVESIESFFNRVAVRNRHPKAICGRTIDAAIPAHLSEEQMIAYVAAVAQRLTRQYRVGVLAVIHRPPAKSSKKPIFGAAGDGGQGSSSRNWHAHFLMSYCTVDEDGVLGRKQPLLDPNDCIHARVMNFADAERPAWALATNDALEQAGYSDRVDHRTLLAQGSMDLPTKHMGPEAWAAEQSDQPKKGFRYVDGRNHSRIGDYNRSVRALNEQRREERSMKAARLQRFIAAKAAELETLRAALDRKAAAVRVDLGSKAEGRRLLSRARDHRRRDHICRVDRRHQLVFARDGGCFRVDDRFLEILDLGTDALILEFAKSEGLTRLRAAVDLELGAQRARLSTDKPGRLLPDIDELRRRYVDDGSVAKTSFGSTPLHPVDDATTTVHSLERPLPDSEGFSLLPRSEELRRLHFEGRLPPQISAFRPVERNSDALRSEEPDEGDQM